MPGESLLDLQALHQITGGDQALEQELMTLYVQTAESCLLRMEAAAGQGGGDWTEAVHEFRGASASIRAEQLASLCRHAESLDDESLRVAACTRIRSAYGQLKSLLSITTPRQ